MEIEIDIKKMQLSKKEQFNCMCIVDLLINNKWNHILKCWFIQWIRINANIAEKTKNYISLILSKCLMFILIPLCHQECNTASR